MKSHETSHRDKDHDYSHKDEPEPNEGEPLTVTPKAAAELGASQALRLFAPASRNADADSSSIDIKGYIGTVLLVLDCGAGTGTTPTANFIVKDSPDNVTFTAVPGLAFTQVTNAAASLQTLNLDTRSVKRYVNVGFDINGGSAAFVFSLHAVGQKQLQ